jgi:hypothetical protein
VFLRARARGRPAAHPLPRQRTEVRMRTHVSGRVEARGAAAPTPHSHPGVAKPRSSVLCSQVHDRLANHSPRKAFQTGQGRRSNSPQLQSENAEAADLTSWHLLAQVTRSG